MTSRTVSSVPVATGELQGHRRREVPSPLINMETASVPPLLFGPVLHFTNQGLKTTEMCCLTVLGTGGLRSRCQQGWFLLEVLGQDRIQSSPGLRWLLAVLGDPCLWPPHSSPSSVFTWLLPVCLCVQISLYKGSSHVGFRAHPNPLRPHPN